MTLPIDGGGALEVESATRAEVMAVGARAPSPGSSGLIGPRLGPRVAAYIPIQVHLTNQAETLVARSRDVGIGGVCIATREDFPVLEVESVSIEFPGRTLSSMARGCWQRRVEDEDAVLSGIQFVDCSLEVRGALAEMVQKRAHEIACFLEESESLRGLDLDDRLELAKFSRLRQVPANRVVYRASDREIESLFVVFRGSVSIRSAIASVEDRVLPQGRSFGGRSLIADLPSIETCTAREDTQLLEIDVYAFRFLEFARPMLARRVMRAILQWALPSAE